MSQVAGARHTCENCGKTFVPKPEWMGKKVKCRCGYVMSIPLPPVQPQEPPADDLYDLAPEGPAVKAKQHVAPPELVAAAASTPVMRSPGGSGAIAAAPVLGYTSKPNKVAEDRFSASSSTMMDPTRDLYAPLGFLIGGLIIYVSYYATRYDMSASGIAFTAIGLSLLTAFKAALLFGFALVVAGPLGVSFGGIFTAALKLAAIAVFCDGVTTWVDALVGKFAGGGGFFDGIMSFPVAIMIYWSLLIYLFSMDPGDSWMVAIILAVFDCIVRWVLIIALLGVIMNLGGASGFGASAKVQLSSEDLTYQEAKDDGSLQEAVAFAKDHPAILQQQTAAFYAAGAKGCYFEVSRDINGKMTITGYVVELPKEPEKRAKIFQIKNDYYKERYKTDTRADTDDGKSNWMGVSIY